MRLGLSPRFLSLAPFVAFGLGLAFGVANAHAQPRQAAPITYAGQSQQGAAPVITASLENGLAGGDERSYGYGVEQRPARSSGAVIDIRRTTAPARVDQAPMTLEAPARTEARAEAAQANGGQARPAWLEQERVGPPYEANGRWYVPTPEPGYEEVGQASWYGPNFHGAATSSGEPFDQEALTAAHPTLPIPSLVQVTNLENGREVIVRVNDRGPFVGERLIDVSRRTADVLGFQENGTTRVHVRYLGPAPRHVTAENLSNPSAPRPVAQAPVAAMQQAAQAEEGPSSLLPPGFDPAPMQQTPAAPYQARVEAPAPATQTVQAPTTAGAGGFMIQIGAFSNMDNAQRVRSAVAQAGPVVVDTRQTARGELFRVRVGPFADRAAAEAARSTLADLGYAEAVLAR